MSRKAAESKLRHWIRGVCAICSVAHTLTSIKATESAFGIEVSPQTGTLRDLMFRGENIESHALHLFCLALPDYLGYPSAVALAADDPGAVKLGLRMKKLGNSFQETIGGRAVHPVNAVPGGFGTLPTADQLIALRADLQQGLEDSEAMVTLLGSARQLGFDHGATPFGDLRSPKDYGYYLGDTVAVLTQGKEEAIPVTEYRSLTNEKAVAHSHAKHSSYRGSPFMVGALRPRARPRAMS